MSLDPNKILALKGCPLCDHTSMYQDKREVCIPNIPMLTDGFTQLLFSRLGEEFSFGEQSKKAPG